MTFKGILTWTLVAVSIGLIVFGGMGAWRGAVLNNAGLFAASAVFCAIGVGGFFISMLVRDAA